MALVMREQQETAVTSVNASATQSKSRNDILDDGAPSDDRIAAAAYALFEERGREHGRDLDDWLEAERRLSGEAMR